MFASFSYESRSPEDTARLARQLGERAFAGMLITLDGDLGAGKTTFSQAFAAAIGVKEPVNSPTFTLIKEYEGDAFPFYHMDAYRLSLMEADDLGLDEYFYGDGVTLLEWAERIEPMLPPERLEMRLEVGTENERYFTLYPHGSAYLKLCMALRQNGVLQ
jgi:tRNA threonylcarbamoyladenosine biosynthesis protein TsaE